MRKKRVLALITVLVLMLSTMAGAASYTVAQGDVLWRIAQAYGFTWEEVAQANNLANPNELYVGQVLTMPTDTNTSATVDDEPAGDMVAGTYTENVTGFSAMVVEVTLSDSEILAVEVVSHNETAGISDAALARIPTRIVEEQNLEVAAVAGATLSSNAIIMAAKNAVMKAGGDSADFVAVEVETIPDEIQVPDMGEDYVWDKEYDVLVIGAGGAGLTAAIQASDSGADTVGILEKTSVIGGTTFISQGMIGGYETRLTEAGGHTQTADEMYDLLMSNASYKLDPVLARITTDRSGESIEWLIDTVEMPFNDTVLVGYGPYAMMHVVTGGGPAMREPYQRALDARGIEVMLETPGEMLLRGADGELAGVMATDADGNNIYIKAGAVVIATGGYAGSKDLPGNFWPLFEPMYPIGHPATTGDGILMASDFGASLSSMNNLMAVLKDYFILKDHNGTSATAAVGRFLNSGGAILVGKDGTRFINERNAGFMSQDQNDPILAQMMKDETPYVWAIQDQKGIDDLELKRGLDLEYTSADTIAELAELMGVNEENLVATVEQWNEMVAAGVDTELGRETDLISLETGPYYAMAVAPAHIITYGGITRDENAQVLRADGSPIDGLYTAGEASSNSAYMGFTISNAITWGRIAGESAAEDAMSK